MPTRLTFKEALERQGETPTERRVVSGSPARLRLSRPGPIPRPVTAIKTIAEFGTSLRIGHDAVDRLAAGEQVTLDLTIPHGRDAIAEFADLGIDAKVLERNEVDIRALRQRLALTQAEFAIRFGLELDTVQSWEQGRNPPDPAARVLLKVIEQNPEAVDAALAGR